MAKHLVEQRCINAAKIAVRKFMRKVSTKHYWCYYSATLVQYAQNPDFYGGNEEPVHTGAADQFLRTVQASLSVRQLQPVCESQPKANRVPMAKSRANNTERIVREIDKAGVASVDRPTTGVSVEL